MEPLAVDDAVLISVPPSTEHVHVVRAVTAAVASRLGLPYDAIEDLRLAVDEASGRLLALRADARALTARLEAHPDRLEIVVGLEGAVGGWPPEGLEEGLSWQILLALCDALRAEVSPAGPSIRLVKRLAEPATDR